MTCVAFRHGLLALTVATLVMMLTEAVPMMRDISHSSTAPGAWTMGALVALACFGFYASRTGQPLFGKILRE